MSIHPIDLAIDAVTRPHIAIAVAVVTLLGVGTVVLLDVLERRSEQ